MLDVSLRLQHKVPANVPLDVGVVQPALFRQRAGAPVARAVSNPPCTLRGTGVNRFDPLCWNPQDRAVEPWRYRDGTAYRLVVKDNHRPCLPSQADVDRACGVDAWSGGEGEADDGFPASAAPAPFSGGPTLPHLTWASRRTVDRL